MIKSFSILLVSFLSLSAAPIKETPKSNYSYTSRVATCKGASSCKACKNCKYCKHCKKDGGTCGVCK